MLTLTEILLCPRRCLLNVVGNSLKFTRAGTVKITLRDAGLIPSAPPLRYSPPLGEEVERRLITFTVADTGIGMTDDFVRDRKYLTPFIQADPFVYVPSRLFVPQARDGLCSLRSPYLSSGAGLGLSSKILFRPSPAGL